MYSYGTEAPFHTSALRVNSKLGSHLAQGTWKVLEGFGRGGVKGNTDAERDEGWGGGVDEGNQTLYQIDRAIYLASQLSSMQLLSAKIIGKEKAK